MIRHAQDIIKSYTDPQRGYPDPAFIFQLPDEIYSGSNLYAVQKHFDGPFQFDVFFESGKQKLSRKDPLHLPDAPQLIVLVLSDRLGCGHTCAFCFV